ncbi:MAG: hypothetical protein ACI9J2_000476 [Saprospiraceae bacterium]|jgi:hypothetical protein
MLKYSLERKEAVYLNCYHQVVSPSQKYPEKKESVFKPCMLGETKPEK